MCQLPSLVTALVFGASAETPLILYQPTEEKAICYLPRERERERERKQAFTCLRHTFFSSKAQSFLPDALAQEHGIYNTSSLWQLLNQAKRDAQLRCRLVLTNQGRKASPGINSQFDYPSLAMQ